MKLAGPEVFKFGGVAVGNAEAIRVALEHVRRAAPNVAIVISAMNGITDLLLEGGQAALQRDVERCENAAAEFESRHLALVGELIASKGRAEELRQIIRDSVREMRSMMESINVLEELTPRAQDALVARGERAVARIFAAAAEEIGIDTVYVDAVDVIHTERRLGTIWPNLPKCERAAKKSILPPIADGKIVVLPGYIASGPDGSLVTLGRGGSDFSAAIIARSVGARALTREIKLEPLFHDDGVHSDARAFIENLGALDDAYRERIERARRSGKVLRYVAKIRSRAISVGIEAVPATSPLAHLRGTDNQVAIYSKRYKTNPLVVTGPGAGATVTAAGVLNDIVAIAMEERRRRAR